MPAAVQLSKEDRVLRAARANNLLNDPLLREVLEAIDSDIVNLWRDAVSPEVREKCHAELHGLKRFRDKLEAMIGEGVMAERPKPPEPI